MKLKKVIALFSAVLLLTSLSAPVFAEEKTTAAVDEVTEIPVEISFMSCGIPYHMAGVISYAGEAPHFELTDTNMMWIGTAATPFIYAPLDPSTPLITCTDKMVSVSNAGYGDMTLNGVSLEKDDGFSSFMNALGGESDVSSDGSHVVTSAMVSGSDFRIEIDYLAGDDGEVLSCPTMRIVF